MRPRNTPKVKLVTSVFTGVPGLFAGTLEALRVRFGPLDFLSEPLPFDSTSYYEEEFGHGLQRRVCSFETLVGEDALAGIKTFTNGLEDALAAADGARGVNIDPGIIALPRFILASCKDFAHRIYIGSGVYADLTLVYTGNSFKPLPWTYPDYRTERMIGILAGIRRRYAFATGRG
ncbi:MAG: DUF4416 family protein [Deltaproteobacteria bacterium]|nr:DUF4416 family protein [Deltaproteobacteria bacterium]